MPKVSIIIPVYKAEQFLCKCVDSVLRQPFTDFELLLIDDGSPDRSGEICDEYAAKDSRIRVFHKPNGGVSSARNMGLDNARGEWIGFIDSDDWVGDDFFSPLAELSLYNDKSISIIVFGMQRILIKGNLNSILPSFVGVISVNEFISSKVFPLSSCCCFFLADVVHRNRIRFNPSIAYCEDRSFNFMVALFSEHIYISNTCPYYYWFNENSVVNSARSYSFTKNALDVFYVASEALAESKRLDKSSLFYIYRLQLRTYIYSLCKGFPLDASSDQIKTDLKRVMEQSHYEQLRVFDQLITWIFRLSPSLGIWLYKCIM